MDGDQEIPAYAGMTANQKNIKELISQWLFLSTALSLRQRESALKEHIRKFGFNYKIGNK